MTANDRIKALRKAFSEEALRRMAGARAYERGCEYFRSGLVGPLREADGVIEAEVSGSLDYRSRLWLEGGQLDYSCTCPVGDDGGFCKHLVALGLTFATSPAKSAKAQSRPRNDRAISDGDVRVHLADRSKAQLIELLMRHAEADELLRRRLHTNAVAKQTPSVRLATFRKAIDAATRCRGGYVAYAEAQGFARGIDDVVDSVGNLLDTGQAREVIELAEYALAAVEKAMESVDDSDGYMSPLLERLQDIHHAACVEARPDPVALADRLIDWELRTGWDTFHGAARRYAEILGETGLRTYRRRAEVVWSKVPALKPGDSRATTSLVNRFRITSIMESLAIQSGQLEALVAVKARDLSLPYAFLQIAEIYREAGKRDLALDWAERGMRAFKRDRPDPRLQALLADEYHHRGRHDEAMALIWEMYIASPGLEGFQRLKNHADGIAQWPTWRKQALAHLRKRAEAVESRRPPARFPLVHSPDRSALVAIFLSEKDVASAWAEAHAGGCSDALWMELAALREREHPADAIPIYQRQVERALSAKNNRSYRDAVGLIRKVRTLMANAGSESEFPGYLASVRAAHKQKRNFIKLIDHARWSTPEAE